jgi:hypothetical protein
MSLAWGPQLRIGGGMNRPPERFPLVLEVGETTSVVHPMELPTGTWSIHGFAFMDDERLRTPTITVVAR